MNTHSPGKTEPQFLWWLHDVVGKVPGIENITYAGVTEVAQGDILKAIYTNGHIKDDDQIRQFRVAVSNTTGEMSAHELHTQFVQSVTATLANVMTANKSLPSD